MVEKEKTPAASFAVYLEEAKEDASDFYHQDNESLSAKMRIYVLMGVVLDAFWRDTGTSITPPLTTSEAGFQTTNTLPEVLSESLRNGFGTWLQQAEKTDNVKVAWSLIPERPKTIDPARSKKQAINRGIDTAVDQSCLLVFLVDEILTQKLGLYSTQQFEETFENSEPFLFQLALMGYKAFKAVENSVTINKRSEGRRLDRTKFEFDPEKLVIKPAKCVKSRLVPAQKGKDEVGCPGFYVGLVKPTISLTKQNFLRYRSYYLEPETIIP